MSTGIRVRIGAIILVGFGLAAIPVRAGNCSADAEVGRFWVERDGFVQKASVRARVNSARPGSFVTVHIELEFQFERSDGWSNSLFTHDSIGINTTNTSSAQKVFDTNT